MSSDFSPRVTSDGVDVLPPGPSAGATQDDILAGFMAAGAAAKITIESRGVISASRRKIHGIPMRLLTFEQVNQKSP